MKVEWEFYPEYQVVDGFLPAWVYSINVYEATGRGRWIKSNHNPPVKDTYLCHSDEPGRWGAKYWDGDRWLSTWPVKYWKPVLAPEGLGEGERFVIEGYRYNSDLFKVLDTDTGSCLMEHVSPGNAENIVKFLNENI